MILYDGKEILVSTSSRQAELKLLASRLTASFLPSVPAYAFVPSRLAVLELAEIFKGAEGSFSPEFVNLLAKVRKAGEMQKTQTPVVQKVQQAAVQKNEYALPASLYSFQKEDVSRMLSTSSNVLLALDMGLGKTVEAAVTYKFSPQMLPAVFVCPASLKSNWKIELNKWAPQYNVYIITGRNTYQDPCAVSDMKRADIVILNYDILGIDDKEAQKAEKARIEKAKAAGYRYRKAYIPVHGWVDELQALKYKSVLLDECQAIESAKAVRTRGVIQLCKDPKVRKIFLSGTPYETHTSQFYNALHILAPNLFPDEWGFKYRYCNPVKTFFGWQFNGASNIPELRAKLSTIMIRHKMDDVMKELPQTQRIVVYLDIDAKGRESYDSLEQELVQKKDDEIFSYLAKMKSALLGIKKEACIQYIKDMLELEDKVVVFVYHTEMFDTVMSAFGKTAVGLNGGTPQKDRQSAVDAFQTDPNIHLFVGQIKAAGVGLTLTAAHACIFLEFGSTVSEHEQAECRIRRIGQKADHCLCYYLLVKDTIDEDAMPCLEAHNKDIKAVMDGKDASTVQMFDLNSAVVVRCRNRLLMHNQERMQLIY